MNRIALFVLLAASLAAPALGAAAEQQKVLSSVSVDFDGNGKMDLAELVLINPESPGATLGENNSYMLADSERVDLVLRLGAASGKPSFVKQKIVDPDRAFMISAIESKSKGSVSVRSCYGCGAMQSWEETLTIAYRGGHFVVAGLSRGWEWGTHLADGNVDTIIGSCDINYLTGKGRASKDLSNGKPLKARFRLVRLADWSESRFPKACEFY